MNIIQVSSKLYVIAPVVKWISLTTSDRPLRVRILPGAQQQAKRPHECVVFLLRTQISLCSVVVHGGAMFLRLLGAETSEPGVDFVMRNELQNQVQSFENT